MRGLDGLPRRAIASRAADAGLDFRLEPGRMVVNMHRMRRAARCMETVISPCKARISRFVCVMGCFHFLFCSALMILCADYPEREGAVRLRLWK